MIINLAAKKRAHPGRNFNRLIEVMNSVDQTTCVGAHTAMQIKGGYHHVIYDLIWLRRDVDLESTRLCLG